MSLKAFHVVFVISTILLCFGFGAWAIHARMQGGSLFEFVLGLVSLVGGVAMIVYFKAVLKKLRNISYL
jgi:hypothetical protein